MTFWHLVGRGNAAGVVQQLGKELEMIWKNFAPSKAIAMAWKLSWDLIYIVER